jgi:hypothetical protein
MIIQVAYPPSNVVVDDILKTTGGTCYRYIGNFVGYAPPSGFIIANTNIFTSSAQTVYDSCVECNTPSITGTTYKTWEAKGEYSVACPVCQLTNFGAAITFYTSSANTIMQTGVYIYKDINLTKPVTIDYVQYGTKIYRVDTYGMVTEYCTLNGNCKKIT